MDKKTKSEKMHLSKGVIANEMLDNHEDPRWQHNAAPAFGDDGWDSVESMGDESLPFVPLTLAKENLSLKGFFLGCAWVHGQSDFLNKGHQLHAIACDLEAKLYRIPMGNARWNKFSEMVAGQAFIATTGGRYRTKTMKDNEADRLVRNWPQLVKGSVAPPKIVYQIINGEVTLSDLHITLVAATPPQIVIYIGTDEAPGVTRWIEGVERPK